MLKKHARKINILQKRKNEVIKKTKSRNHMETEKSAVFVNKSLKINMVQTKIL